VLESHDLVGHIVSFLSLPDLVRLAATSKAIHDVLSDGFRSGWLARVCPSVRALAALPRYSLKGRIDGVPRHLSVFLEHTMILTKIHPNGCGVVCHRCGSGVPWMRYNSGTERIRVCNSCARSAVRLVVGDAPYRSVPADTAGLDEYIDGTDRWSNWLDTILFSVGKKTCERLLGAPGSTVRILVGNLEDVPEFRVDNEWNSRFYQHRLWHHRVLTLLDAPGVRVAVRLQQQTAREMVRDEPQSMVTFPEDQSTVHQAVKWLGVAPDRILGSVRDSGSRWGKSLHYTADCMAASATYLLEGLGDVAQEIESAGKMVCDTLHIT
jgi:hypothetical protein